MTNNTKKRCCVHSNLKYDLAQFFPNGLRVQATCKVCSTQLEFFKNHRINPDKVSSFKK